jgi:hypothetical protein
LAAISFKPAQHFGVDPTAALNLPAQHLPTVVSKNAGVRS